MSSDTLFVKTKCILTFYFRFLLEILSMTEVSTIENFIVVWLDGNQNFHDTDIKASITRLQQLVHLILPFPDAEQCIDFISEIEHEKIFLIISDTFGRQLLPLINSFQQIDSIYVYCRDRGKNERWALKEEKIKGVFTKIEPIYDAIRRDTRQCEDDLIPFSILSSKYQDLNRSDQLFIYAQLMKEILLQLEYYPDMKFEFTEFCSLIYQNNRHQLNQIEKFGAEYSPSLSIRWYTSECFVYSILNKAFRIQDMTMLMKMGFFVRDLHQDIERRHAQLNNQNRLKVYRGQGISEEAFQQLLDHSDGFLSFNNFLITTIDKDLSLFYARSARDNHSLVGVLFQMEIDRATALYTSLDKISYYGDSDKEMIFSTHTIFRIHGVQQIENGLWQIQLRLTMDEEKELQKLKQYIREMEGKNAWEQLDRLSTQLRMMNESETMEIEQPVTDDACQERAAPDPQP